MNIFKEIYDHTIKQAWFHGIYAYLILMILTSASFFSARAIYNGPAQEVIKENLVLKARINELIPLEEMKKAKESIATRIPSDLDRGYRIILTEAIYDASTKYKISPDMIAAIIKVESNFQADAVSGAGAQGFMQVMPSTFDMMQNMHKFGGTVNEPYANVQAGTSLLRYLYDMYEKKGVHKDALWVYVLFGYNTGKEYQHGTGNHYPNKVITAKNKIVSSTKE